MATNPIRERRRSVRIKSQFNTKNIRTEVAVVRFAMPSEMVVVPDVQGTNNRCRQSLGSPHCEEWSPFGKNRGRTRRRTESERRIFAVNAADVFLLI